MDIRTDIWRFAPATWVRDYKSHNHYLVKGTEYQQIEYDVQRAVKNLKKVLAIWRVQNIFHYGQFLMRSQILAREDSVASYYKVRRYVAIPTSLVETAMEYNLDHRRLNMENIEFCSHLPYVEDDHSIFVVCILTKDVEARCISPYDFTEYYIDYVVDIDIF
ncbi:hypothetical protein WA026_001472 [Henosepilachna vigintioctopunctata]|uniref:Uncharacterized protein n=1 Tax=Henosepilachna vigintioctopunctata TaxID=420089 RepID=A0AAW1UUP5_9CUCU